MGPPTITKNCRTNAFGLMKARHASCLHLTAIDATISVRIVFIELSRGRQGRHQSLHGIDFDTTILSLLPEHYIFAELRASGIVQIGNLAECRDTAFFAVPKERRHELQS